jgi:hypothetical protein
MCNDPTSPLRSIADHFAWMAELVEHGAAGWSLSELLDDGIPKKLAKLRISYHYLSIMGRCEEVSGPLTRNIDLVLAKLNAWKKANKSK